MLKELEEIVRLTESDSIGGYVLDDKLFLDTVSEIVKEKLEQYPNSAVLLDLKNVLHWYRLAYQADENAEIGYYYNDIIKIVEQELRANRRKARRKKALAKFRKTKPESNPKRFTVKSNEEPLLIARINSSSSQYRIYKNVTDGYYDGFIIEGKLQMTFEEQKDLINADTVFDLLYWNQAEGTTLTLCKNGEVRTHDYKLYTFELDQEGNVAIEVGLSINQLRSISFCKGLNEAIDRIKPFKTVHLPSCLSADPLEEDELLPY